MRIAALMATSTAGRCDPDGAKRLEVVRPFGRVTTRQAVGPDITDIDRIAVQTTRRRVPPMSMTTHERGQDDGRTDRHDRDQDEGARPDPDAPGNYVDDEDATEVPEPNEPA